MAKRLSKAERAEQRTATIRRRVLDIFSGAIGGECIDDSTYALRETMGIDEFSRAVAAINDVFSPLGRREDGQPETILPHCWGKWEGIDDVVEWLDGRSEVQV